MNTTAMFDIAGKVALITGGGQGIGLATAKELLKNKLKAVAIIDINEVIGQKAVREIQEEFGEGKAIFLNYDVSIRTQFEEAFKATINAFQHLDVVINNAGIVNEEDWERTIDVNLTGTINGTLLALENYLPQSKIGEEAVILNVSSIGAFTFFAATPTYNATKCGIISVTCCLGHPLHYERKKVKVMAVCPGVTETDLFNRKNVKPLNENCDKLGDEFQRTFPHEIQTAEDVARGAVHIIKEGQSGSIWIAENKNPPYEVDYVAMQNIRRYN
ncbi:hypothetical protein RI129_008260 [Pyrocoelia pectoralis]|uniref:Alcohol dehydrogenase n=1 Tax=Pyrocoelia pectoralis TaxID=417401 RepID=A0AAN7VAW4_9COLE